MALFGSSKGPSNAVLDSIRSSLPQQLPHLDAHTLEKLKAQALTKAKNLREQVCGAALPLGDLGAFEHLADQHFLHSGRAQAAQSSAQVQAISRDLAGSQDVQEAGSKVTTPVNSESLT